MRFFAELKRRNVIRMAGLYLVGAWLIIQIAETLLPIFRTPDWVLQTLVVLLAIGFLPALVFSWLFELTPEGIKRDGEVSAAESITGRTGQRMDRLIFAGLLALIAVIAADRFWPAQPLDPQDDAVAVNASAEPATAAATLQKPSPAPDEINPNAIAVLPFVNMSADADNEYFSDGISEELLNVLVRVEGLDVASRTSSFAYKGRNLGTQRIAEELRVSYLLEGSVRKSGSRVRITAQLIDADNDRHLWSETYDRELTDIFAIQDEIATAIVSALRETLGERIAAPAQAVRADTDNLDAYQTYLKARELFLTRRQLDESVRLYEQAVSLDPEFARGWEGLAAASAVIVDWNVTYPDIDRLALIQRAEEAAERALALDPSLSTPWAARGLVVGYQMPVDFSKSMDLLDRAITADPRNASAILWRGINWMILGFHDRAAADFERCLVIDPAYGNCQRWDSLNQLFYGRRDDALALYELLMADGFNHNRGHSFVEPLLRRGDRFAAILLMRELDWPLEIQHAVLDHIEGRPPSSDIAAMIRRYPGSDRPQFEWSLILREYALAAELDLGSNSVVQFWDPAYEGLRNSPAFRRILQRIGVPTYWQARGYPPQCRALGEDDYECDQPAPNP